MDWQTTTYFLPLAMLSLITAVLGVAAWRNRPAMGMLPFALMAGSVTIWLAGYALELSSTNLEWALLWARVQYVGITAIPVAWLAFAWHFTGQLRWLTRRWIVGLAVVPLVTIALVWTNDFERQKLIWSSVEQVTSGDIAMLSFEYGPFFWVHTTYSYGAVVIASLWLMWKVNSAGDLYRSQALIMALAVTIPFAANVVFVFGLSPLPDIDLTPLTFSLSILLVAWGLFRYRLMDMTPIARNLLIESMLDGVLVLNTHNDVVDMNLAAEQATGYTASEVTGSRVEDLVVPWIGELKQFLTVEQAHTSITLPSRKTDEKRHFDLRISPVKNRGGKLLGRIVVWRDITAEKQTQLALENSERRYRRIVEETGDILYTADLRGLFTYVNPRGALLTEYTPDELLTMHFLDLIPQEWKKQLEAYYEAQVKRRIRETTFTFPIETKTGKRRWVEQTVILMTKGSRVRGVQAVVRDISERKHIEEALRQSEERLRSLFASMSDVIFTLNKEGQFIDFYQPESSRLGAAPNEYLARHYLNVLPSGVAEKLTKAIAALDKANSPQAIQTLEFALPSADSGEEVWFAVNVSAVFNGQQEIDGYLGVARDVTERRRVEQAEREQRILAEALRDTAEAVNSTLNLEAVLDLILVSVERVVRHNAANVHLVDGEVASIARARGYEDMGASAPLVGNVYRWTDMLFFNKMIENGQPVVVVDTQDAADWIVFPETAWIRSSVSAPIFDGQSVLGFLNLDSDVPNSFTEDHARKLQVFANQAAVAIKNAKLYAELQERNAELDAYSHTIAHDLKGPLGNIKGFAELVLNYEKTLSERSRHHLDVILRSSLNLSNMVDQLLRLARLRDAVAASVPVEMESVIMGATGRFQVAIEERGIALHIDPSLPPVLGHGPWLEEVIANLVGNAVKYIGSDNPDPTIWIRGRVEQELVVYEVEDNGLGIAAEDQANLFEMFSRFHTGQAPGIGLGLNIVRRIITRLDGQLGVESQPGKGSRFWFSLSAPGDGGASEKKLRKVVKA